ncbi:MAG: hypothetical protein IJS24_01775 [Eubacterium sp.]|nr:hypothetical protein [Eubacterium sp.]
MKKNMTRFSVLILIAAFVLQISLPHTYKSKAVSKPCLNEKTITVFTDTTSVVYLKNVRKKNIKSLVIRVDKDHIAEATAKRKNTIKITGIKPGQTTAKARLVLKKKQSGRRVWTFLCNIKVKESDQTAFIPSESVTVSYLGPEGTYTQEACGVFFGKKGKYEPYKTVNEAVGALISGNSDYAVIPQENTIGGAVIDYVDTLIAQTDVSVVGEVELQISQNLLGLPGSDIDNIKTVYSHKQGITQGKEWLEKNIPNAEVIEVSSTAEGARRVAEEKDPTKAAIASITCTDIYGLELLAGNIQNNDNNKTRFYVLSTKTPEIKYSGRMAFIAAGPAKELPALLSVMNDRDVTLVTIHDRPAKTILGQYLYVMECSGCSYRDYLEFCRDGSFEFRYLGSFDILFTV